MVEIGGKPMLWHIMKLYAHHGVTDFVVCLGYKGYVIKEYFANYYLHTSDVTFDVASGSMEVHHSTTEPWRVTLVETGEQTQTGGRLKRVLPYIGDERFCFTYGDGLSDLDLTDVIRFHEQQDVLATVTAVQPAGRFGALELEDGAKVTGVEEKPRGDHAWINGGFFVCEPGIERYIDGDDTIWEQESMRGLVGDGQLAAYRYTGFWQAMDTLRERNQLEAMWRAGDAPWKTWE
jgi:glucose-1-phosphate cytidylyltransferase